MINENDYFGKDGHITDMYTAVCSDRLSEEREDLIPQRIRSHLEGCARCRDSVLDIFSSTLSARESSRLRPAMPRVPAPYGQSFPYRLFLRTAATFFIIAFMTAVFLNVNTGNPVKPVFPDNGHVTIQDDPGIAISEQSTQKNGRALAIPPETKGVELSRHDPFKDNPNLEYMVDSPHRGRLIHIISPEFRILGKGSIVFRWENHIDKELKLKILTNLNETLYTFKAEGSRVEFSGELSAGLYYWKLEDSENLYHVGKFLIEK